MPEARPHPAPARPTELAPAAEAPLRWSDPALRTVLLLALALLLFAWSRIDGYQLADSVEYMERARSLARGETQDASRAVRSFGFSILLTPFFLAERVLGLEDGRIVVGAIRAFQVLLALGLVAACARVGALFGGRRAGLAAGLLVAVNPIFLQYGASPISGIAAGLCVALAFERLLPRGAAMRPLAGGLWLGAAFLMAYQAFLVAVPLLLLCALREGRRGWRRSGAAAIGLFAAILVQIVLDRLTWGAWGVSVGSYLFENSRGVAVTFLDRLGMRETAWRLYQALSDFDLPDASSEPRQKQPRSFYVLEIRTMLVWPVLALGALGLLRAARRPTWAAWILALVFAANVATMSLKGDKSFRLWLPLLPAIAPLCAYGLALAWDARPGRAGTSRAAAVALVLAACAGLGLARYLELDTRRFGVFWEASEIVNRAAAREAGERSAPARMGSSYHWAVFHRQSAEIELVKLPHHLHAWTGLAPELRAECVEALGTLDWFVTHRPAIEQEQSLFEALNAAFEVHDFAWDAEADPDLGAVLVLRRRTGTPAARLLCDARPPEDADSYRARLGLDRALPLPLDFLGPGADGAEGSQRLRLLGFEYRRLPETGCGWIVYHWTTPTGLERPVVVVDRLTPPDGAHAWHNNHPTCYGFHPADRWRPGEIVVEGYPVLPGNDAFTSRFEPMGGPYRRGDYVPVELWMSIVHAAEDGTYFGGLRPARAGAPRPFDMSAPELLPGERRRGEDGFVESKDELARVGSFLLPLPPEFRWPDDGRGDPP